MKRMSLILLALIVAIAATVCQQYHGWATNASGSSDPFDEVGINLHSYMPGFVRDWGCAKLKVEFGTKTLPPYGCGAADDPAKWQ